MINIRDYLNRAAMYFPNHEVVIHKETRLTTTQLLDRTYRVSNMLLDLGLRKGDRVAVLLQNCHQCVECFHGINSAGLVLVPLNARNANAEHLYMLNNAEASAILFGGEFKEAVLSILPEAKTVSHAICVTGKPPKTMPDYEELLQNASPEEPQVDISQEDMMTIRYTSGTTGKPKGVLHTHRNIITTLQNALMEDTFRIQEGDVIALMGPVTHASGSMILPHIVRGAKVIILSGFDPKGILELIEKERVSTLYLVPTMIVMMLAQPDIEKYDLSSLKTIRYGASPISPEVLKRAIQVFGDVFIQGYGLTEGSMPLTLLSKKDHVLDGTEKQLNRLNSVGREVLVAKVRIMDEEGNILPPGEIGEIVVRSEQNMKGYWKNPEATKEALRGGWLHTRDMGYMDEEGYLFLVDRKEDMIISGGFNVYPKEVEDVLYRHPAVLEAAVFGVPDEKWGEAVRAAVSLKAGKTATEEEIIAHCKKHLASYKKPQRVDFLADLPKNAYGKILRRVLKEPFWKGKTRKVN
ncbi:MAG: long-chain-fatty-acid--CoA ligase [Deltaproteobacteria bacterium]|nr:long-chain-fatty-acid--CoA ligase [Deltaproteobacteria bacterium]MBW1923784.1 long-chain-fatty-acid--CoA ligase [Deltaproteobacteria bacterium]MBW1949041.1 long-chain-fatty-acid--CoA ligase [Deltaproteobacteria bacterium]MBW2008567.1 long-chain-fatty-acid--CoA ligase [Deltaproteobacteria bacterium]MBW2103214.1 long-chain-fatty-acid--CoA ligase [Deltaproteobacteria bacterium]